MPGLLDALMFQNQPMADMPMGMLGGAPGGTPMLPFRDRWAPAQNAHESGTFDVVGRNNMPGMPNDIPMPRARPLSDGAVMPPNAGQTVGQMPQAPMSMAPPPSPDVTAPAPSASSSGNDIWNSYKAAGGGSDVSASARALGGIDAPGTSLLGRMGSTLGSFPQALMKMGAGFAGAPNLGQGMSRAFAGGAEGLKADQQKMALGDTFQALVKSGVPPAQAMAAIAAQQGGNPALLSGLAAKHFGPQHLMNVGGQLRDPNSGAMVGQGPGEIVTIQDPSTGLPTSAMKYPDGRVEKMLPGNIPNAGQPPVQVGRIEEALKLPPGTPFIDPYGIPRVR